MFDDNTLNNRDGDDVILVKFRKWIAAAEAAHALGRATGDDDPDWLAAEDHAFGLGQQPVAPVERRPQGLMPRQCGASAAGQ
jgi:hypothetical protein